MSFTNINDPAGVKALLEQLRSSQAWQDTVARSNPTFNPAPATGGAVAALLSQLQNPPAAPADTEATDAAIPVNSKQSPERPAQRQDLKSYTLQQSLPVLAELCDDPKFVSLITQMKEEQADLERKLWTERRAIFKKYEDKVNAARVKANMIGTGISKHEADMIMGAFNRELGEFDRMRILPAWDGLIAKQQATLEAQRVPTMAVTSVSSDRERQQRVIRVLEGI